MVGIPLLVMLALFVVAAVVIFKIAQSVLQGVLLVSAVLAVILAIIAVVVVKDAIDFQHNFQSGSKLLLFSADNGTRITSGLLVKGNGSAPLSEAEVGQLNAWLGSKDYAAMRGDNFKLVVLREEPILAAMPEGQVFDGSNMSREMALLQLRAAKVEQRAQLLSALFAMQFSGNPLVLVSGYKNGDVVVYPETPVFRAVRILPESLFSEVSGKLLGNNLQAGMADNALPSAA